MLEAKNVVKTFGGFRALDGATLRVPQGAVYGLVGPNGAGKSTIILPAARHVLGRALGHKAALAGDGDHIALLLQLAIGPGDGVGVDGQLRGQGPDAGQLFPGLQHPGDHELPKAVLDLLVDGPGVPIVQMDHAASLLSAKCTNRVSTLIAHSFFAVKPRRRKFFLFFFGISGIIER